MSEKSPAQLTAEEIMNMPTYNVDGRDVESVAKSVVDNPNRIGWSFVCQDSNNRGSVEICKGLIDALVELVTNSNDAYLYQHLEDADSWGELIELVSDNIVNIGFTGDHTGRGSKGEFSVTVQDEGCGVSVDEFEDAFVRDPSTGGVDKTMHDLLYGEFAQGSLGSIGISKHGCKFIASASKDDPGRWKWTIVKRTDNDNYKYMTAGSGELPAFEGVFEAGDIGRMEYGTVAKVFDVNVSKTPDTVVGGPFLRELGHKFPKMAVPARIHDFRDGRSKSRDWRGMMPELDRDPKVRHMETSSDVSGTGHLKLHAFYSEGGFHNEFVSSNVDERLFFMVHGMTHYMDTHRTLKSKCDLNGISKDVLLFVECSGLNRSVGDIFMASRDDIRDKSESDKLKSSVYEAIRDWDELQEVDEEMSDITDKFGVNGRSPIHNIEFCSEDSSNEFVVSDGYGSVELVCDYDVEDYLEGEHVSCSVYGEVGHSCVSVEGNTIRIEVQDRRDCAGFVRIEDEAFDETVSRDFSVRVSDALEDEAEEFAKRAHECAEPTMISRDDYIPSGDLDKKIENHMKYIELLSDVNNNGSMNIQSVLSHAFIEVDDTKEFAEFVFELLSYPGGRDEYEFRDVQWSMSEVVDDIDAGNYSKASWLAGIAVDVGIDRVPVGDRSALKSFYMGMLNGGCSDLRKQLQGDLYEESVGAIIQDAVDSVNEEKNRNLQVKGQHKYSFSSGHDSKTFDHIITDEDGNILLVFEENCYSTGGSKIGEFARSSNSQIQDCYNDGLEYIRVTDGSGVSENEYKKAYMSVQGNMYNLELLNGNFADDLRAFLNNEKSRFEASY